MDVMDAVKEIRKLVPLGFDLIVNVSKDDPDTLVSVLVLHGKTCVTVIGPGDFRQQVADDTCERHRSFACPHCFPTYEEAKP